MVLSLLVSAAERVARNLGVPVGESARGILFPRPHVQRVEIRQPEAIRTLEQVQELSHELRRRRVLRMPVARQNQIVRADELQASVRKRLADYARVTRRCQRA